MLTMVNPIDFGGHSSKSKVMMVIVDECGARGDATLCVVIFLFVKGHFDSKTSTMKMTSSRYFSF